MENQSIDNSVGQNEQKGKKNLIIIGVVLVLLLILLISVTALISNSKKQAEKQAQQKQQAQQIQQTQNTSLPVIDVLTWTEGKKPIISTSSAKVYNLRQIL